MAVEAVGAGFYVRAHVVTRLALSCDCCLATFEQPVDTHFEVSCGTLVLSWQVVAKQTRGVRAAVFASCHAAAD